MAKTTKKKTLTKKTAKATAKAAAKTESKTAQEQLKLTAEPEAKKITAEKEPEKLTTKKIEKITTAKEAEKLTTAPAPEKIETKETVKLATSAAKTTEKAEEKKPTEAKAETKKKPAAKKTAAKKTTKKEESKEEAVKAEDKPVKKAAKKTAAAKKAEPTAKKAVKKTEEKKAEKKPAAKKAAAKKAAPKKADKEKLEAYAALSLDEAIQKAQAMGVQHVYEDYTRFLLDEADSKQIAKNIIDGNALLEKGFTYDKDGFDTDLISVVLEKVADTMDVKAMDYKELKKDITACLKAEMTADAEANAAEYLKEFKVCEKLLMIGQRKNITDAAIVSDLIGADVDAFVAHFFQFAYAILPGWQYDDVKFYEDFAFAVLSQYSDLYEKYQLNILLDVADLYIKHGDFGHGDECYGYILRDNQIKDYIYYRFASVYEDIDFNKAKVLAYESLQYVDGRYTYYQNIMNIINK
ncbi:neurofilament protein [Erysipelotrichaceae bacterium I46]|uniref:neurofilament protein n=1 Tax=Clostridium innocuum TaxID=1522 RepID=UPI00080C4E83|nr:neurofilament protein [[Clostridium] innocuum]ANU68919.1 neurofilament protein [Erysipelotrichaceae bacterium I46]ASU18648.1 neurofilament protein [[Clostridium] innocuum]MCR0303250.1 neurofilament protein [[Clostridium] innocuum]QQR27193.1 neurofilament protein [[Clostridium] innocuum]